MIGELVAEEVVDEQKEEDDDELEWITPGILVKILPHEIETKYHNKKVPITKIYEPYVAELNCDGVILRVDQSHLETVVPKVNNEVMVLAGKYRG